MPATAEFGLFARSSPVCSYWLARCHGFRVETRRGRLLGVVEQVEVRRPEPEPVALLIRRRRRLRRRLLLSVASVVAVAPWEETVVLASPSRARRSAAA